MVYSSVKGFGAALLQANASAMMFFSQPMA
jgi:hypothetical protein